MVPIQKIMKICRNSETYRHAEEENNEDLHTEESVSDSKNSLCIVTTVYSKEHAVCRWSLQQAHVQHCH